MRRALIVLALVFVPSLAFGATRYVDGTISPSSCTNYLPASRTCGGGSDTAYKTFNDGLTATTTAGDILYVRGGTYAELVLAGNAGDGTSVSRIFVTGYTGETVTIQPSGGIRSLDFNNVSYHTWTRININGINETNCGAGCYGASVAFIFSDHITLQDAEIENCYWSCIQIVRGEASAVGIQTSNLEIHDGGRCGGSCDASHGIYSSGDSNTRGVDLEEIHDGNHIYGFTGGNSYAIHLYNGTSETDVGGGVTVRDSIIHDNTNGILLHAARTNPQRAYNNVIYSHTSNGIQLYRELTNTPIYNNTIHDSGLHGIDVDTQAGSFPVSGCLIKNNIVTNSVGAPVRVRNSNTTGHCTIQFNNFNGNGNSNNVQDDVGSSTIGSNITSSPGYTNSGADDYTLASGSANRDAGTLLTLVTTDLLGLARPQGAAYDIGAYEFQVQGPDPDPEPGTPPEGPVRLRVVGD